VNAYTTDKNKLLFHGAVIAECANADWALRLARQMNRTHLITEESLNDDNKPPIDEKFEFAEKYWE
jgi:hypothetical protein